MALHFLHLAAAAAAASPWYEAALARITPPVFRAVDYDIHQYGAAVPDGRTDARDAIKAAITACNRQGGGRVVVRKTHIAYTTPVPMLHHLHCDCASCAI